MSIKRRSRRWREKVERGASLILPGRSSSIRKVLGRAAQAQAQLQQSELPEIPGFSLHGRSRPASAAGGDFFHCMRLDAHRWGVAVGDFSGHDIWAAFFTNLTKGSLMAASRDHNDPRRVLAEVNHDVCRETDRRDYVTLAYGVVDARARTFRFARAGDVQVVWRRYADGCTDSSRQGSLALGWVASAAFEKQVVEGEIQLDAGDAVFLFTDGVPEARSRTGVAWGFEGVERAVRAMSSPNAETIVDQFFGCLDEHAGPGGDLHDDVTLLVLQADTS